MSSSYIPGPGDEATWGPPTGHPHDPRTDDEVDFWDICIDDEIFDDEIFKEDEEQSEDPLEGK